MARKTQEQTEASAQEPSQHRGRKPGQPTNPENSAKRLSEGVSRAVWFLAGSPSSALGLLAARAAKQGISRERVEKGFLMVQEALELARTQMEAAYASPTVNKETVTRPTVSL